MYNSLRPYRLQPFRLSPWDFSGNNIGVGCHFFLQGMLPTQVSNPCLLRLRPWQADSSPLSHLGRRQDIIFEGRAFSSQWDCLCMSGSLVSLTPATKGQHWALPITMTARNTPKHRSLTKQVDSEMEQKVIQFHINILSNFLKLLPEAWRGICKVGEHRLQWHHLPSQSASFFWWECGDKHGTKNHTCQRQDPVTPA